MVLKCCVPGCNSNYKKPYVSVFHFPNNEELKKKWLVKIHRENYIITKYSCVCILHFPKEFVITEDSFVDSEGKITVKRDRPKLIPEAYPTVVGEIAPHLTENVAKRRRTWSEREEEQFATTIKQSVATYAEEINATIISSLNDVVLYIEENFPSVCHTFDDDDLIIMKIVKQECPLISASIIIYPCLEFSVFKSENKLSQEHLESLNVYFNKINTKHDIDVLLEICINNNIIHKIKCLNLAMKNLTEFKLQLTNDKEQKLEFLMKQIQMIETPKHLLRFSTDTYLFSFKMYLSSSSTYSAIRNTKLLTLPHPRSLQKIAKRLSVTGANFEVKSDYLKKRISCLQDNEKIVSLSIDEIYLDDTLTFKAGNLFGTSIHSNETAKTAHVFFVSSIFSNYKDVVGIAPVSCFTSSELHSLTVNMIKNLIELGFCVISIVTDNNAVNSSMFKIFSPHPSFNSAVVNPHDKSPLYLLFDPVHN